MVKVLSMNSSFITLEPKKDKSVMIKDFGPISFVTSVYKLITKVLSIRFNVVFTETILEKRA